VSATTSRIVRTSLVPLRSTLPMAETGSLPGPLADVQTLIRTLWESCRARVQGRDEVIRLILTALFADGHVLLEDHPGSGKTTLAKALGESIRRPAAADGFASFRRIQFTPDLLPSDVTGTTVFDPKTGSFAFRPGPIFANVVLADEINRTSPKVQAALLEAMGEKQVTVDNTTHRLEDTFFVLATQNPHDLVGTYPLPRAQLDRFLYKVTMSYISRESELAVLERRASAISGPPAAQVAPEAIAAARGVLEREVRIPTAIKECLVDISEALRADPRVRQGISTRSLVQAMPALRAWAVLEGRDTVTSEDVAALAVPLFAHRLALAESSLDAQGVVRDCVVAVLARRDGAARS